MAIDHGHRALSGGCEAHVGYTPAGLQKASQGPYLLSTVSQCLMLDGDHVS